ncbi:GtrA family protein [Maribius pontilimi]|uniref:GtrA family protein n=1 Tax=Palleronia pontilimi TaxID=1964209 RepID=A0A934MDN0_9RHOB|nr:GtrA family protein [Palleronia pontilimi]MBJ3763665.1 GtrA family protein [Palleronia pontilimi]
MVLRFLCFSGCAALVNLVTGYLLYGVLGLDASFEYAVSVAIAFVAGMGVSFVLNRAYTFDASGRAAQDELRDFFLVSLGGLLLTTLLAQAIWSGLRVTSLAEGAPVPTQSLAHVAAVGLTAFYSFFAHKHISFRRARSEDLCAAGGAKG